MKLSQFNSLSKAQAKEAISACCVAPRWVDAMLAQHPYSSSEQVFSLAQSLWEQLEEDDYLAAFEGHPQIGDISTLQAKFAATSHKAADEQSGMSKASENTLNEMMAINQAYLEKFGFIFIVCATGKTAEEMLAMIKARITNDRPTELAIAANEQAKITRIRLENLL